MIVQADVRKGLELLFSLAPLQPPVPFFERMREILEKGSMEIRLTPDGAVFLTLLVVGNYSDRMLEPYWQENASAIPFAVWRTEYPSRELMQNFCLHCLRDAAEVPYEQKEFMEKDTLMGRLGMLLRDCCVNWDHPGVLSRIFTLMPSKMDYRITLPKGVSCES